ncbi:MAG: hypothetical protein AAF628_36915, partial [Planctomycetota bacterium]
PGAATTARRAAPTAPPVDQGRRRPTSVLDRLVARPDYVALDELLQSREFNPDGQAVTARQRAALATLLQAHQPNLSAGRRRRGHIRRAELAALAAAGHLERLTLNVQILPPDVRGGVIDRARSRYAREVAQAARQGRDAASWESWLRPYIEDAARRAWPQRYLHRDAAGQTWVATEAQLRRFAAAQADAQAAATALVQDLGNFFERHRLLPVGGAARVVQAYRDRLADG